MNLLKSRPRFADLSPLVLRTVVAGVFVMAAAGRLTPTTKPAEVSPPLPVEAAPDVATFGDSADGLVADVEPLVGDSEAKADERAVLDESGLQVNLGMNELTRLGEIGFAGILLLGVLTRIAAVAGIGMVKLSALTANGVLDANSLTQPFADLYAANPVAMLLFAAICLSLLVSGSGPLSLDRVLFRKRGERQAEPAALA